MKLYSYYRSSAAYRLRIALNLKGLDYEYLPVNLLNNEQRSENYKASIPQGQITAMELPGGEIVEQSIALLEWLEESCTEPALLPSNLIERARVRSVVNSIACEVHPLCNLSITNYLRSDHNFINQDVLSWYKTWMHRGFSAVEQALARNNSRYSFTEQPCMADIFIVPQVYNARRFKIPLGNFPNITRVVDNCNKLSAFKQAVPEMQPDSE